MHVTSKIVFWLLFSLPVSSPPPAFINEEAIDWGRLPLESL